MRQSLRIAAKSFTGLLWIVKGLLLILAVGAVVMWPVSLGWAMWVRASGYTAGPASGEECWYSARCWDGRAVLGRGWMDARDSWVLAVIRRRAASAGEGWHLRRWSEAELWDEGGWSSRWGPLRWDFTDHDDPRWPFHNRDVAAPLWLIALAAGAWPLASIVLLIRRRRRRRRLARVGCCQQCGYDLRATAEANGPLLARCPECGAESAGLERKED